MDLTQSHSLAFSTAGWMYCNKGVLKQSRDRLAFFWKEKKPFFMPILILLRHPLRHIKRNNDPNNTDRKHDCNFTGEHPSNIGSDKSLRKGQLLHHFRLAGVQLEQLHFALRYKASATRLLAKMGTIKNRSK